MFQEQLQPYFPYMLLFVYLLGGIHYAGIAARVLKEGGEEQLSSLTGAGFSPLAAKFLMASIALFIVVAWPIPFLDNIRLRYKLRRLIKNAIKVDGIFYAKGVEPPKKQSTEDGKDKKEDA